MKIYCRTSIGLYEFTEIESQDELETVLLEIAKVYAVERRQIFIAGSNTDYIRFANPRYNQSWFCFVDPRTENLPKEQWQILVDTEEYSAEDHFLNALVNLSQLPSERKR